MKKQQRVTYAVHSFDPAQSIFDHGTSKHCDDENDENDQTSPPIERYKSFLVGGHPPQAVFLPSRRSWEGNAAVAAPVLITKLCSIILSHRNVRGCSVQDHNIVIRACDACGRVIRKTNVIIRELCPCIRRYDCECQQCPGEKVTAAENS